MKSKIVVQKDSVPEDRDYPKIGFAENSAGWVVVLFNKKKQGVILATNFSEYEIGSYEKDWHMGSFEFFKGQVILSND